MGNSITQRVIDFTANYLSISPGAISPSDTFSSVGIPKPEMPVFIEALEDSFDLAYQPGDENGIITVEDAIVFITNKIG